MPPATLEQNHTTQKTIYTRWGKTTGIVPLVFPHFLLMAVQTVMDAGTVLTMGRTCAVISALFPSRPTLA